MLHPLILPGARSVRRIFFALLLGLVLLSLPSQSYAATSSCRGDPIIYLSNGAKIQLMISVNIDAASVTDVTYTVHIPAGVTVTSINMAQTATTTILASKEHINTIADLAAKQYKTSTVVTTTKPASVTVTGIFTPSSGATGTTLNAAGTNGVAIPINYIAP